MVVRIILFFIFTNLLGGETVQYGSGIFIDAQDARNAGMGGYSISISGGRNPAMLIHAQEPSIYFSSKDKFAGLSRVSSISYLHYGMKQGNQSPIYISIVNRSVENIFDTRSAWLDNGNSTPEIGEINYYNIKDISQNELGLKVAFFRRYNSFVLGTCLKPTYTSLADYSAWGISGDIAALVQLFEKKMDITIRVEDIISINKWSTGRNETIIPLITAGGQIQLASLLLGIQMGSHVMGNSPLNYNAGFEFHQQDEIVIFRGGISHNHLFSVGIGLNLKMIQIDYAYLHPPKNSPFEPSQIVSVGIFLEKFDWTRGKITP